jgi:hypothetical protein
MRVEHLIAKSSQESLNVIEKERGQQLHPLRQRRGDRYQRPGEPGTHHAGGCTCCRSADYPKPFVSVNREFLRGYAKTPMILRLSSLISYFCAPLYPSS